MLISLCYSTQAVIDTAIAALHLPAEQRANERERRRQFDIDPRQSHHLGQRRPEEATIPIGRRRPADRGSDLYPTAPPAGKKPNKDVADVHTPEESLRYISGSGDTGEGR